MGIMNKMKTVAAWLLDWQYFDDYQGDSRYYSESLKQTAIPKGKMQYNKYFITEGVSGWGTTEGSFLSNIGVLEIQTNRFKGLSAEAFKQHLQDENVLLTYETIASVEEKIVNSMKTKATPTWTYSNDYAYIILNDRKPGANVAYAWNKPLPANIRFYFNTTNLGCVLSFPHAEYPSRDAINAVMADKVLTYQANTDITEEII